MPVFKIIYLVFWSLFVSRSKLSLEMLALYQQLAVLQRSIPRPQLRNRDRLFWIVVVRQNPIGSEQHHG
jgi:hypothetical protein